MKWDSEKEYILRQIMEEDNSKLARQYATGLTTQSDKRTFWDNFLTRFYSACEFKEGDTKPTKTDIRKKWSYLIQKEKEKYDRQVRKHEDEARKRSKYRAGTGGGPGVDSQPLLDPDTLEKSSQMSSFALFKPLPLKSNVHPPKPRVKPKVAERSYMSEEYESEDGEERPARRSSIAVAAGAARQLNKIVPGAKVDLPAFSHAAASTELCNLANKNLRAGERVTPALLQESGSSSPILSSQQRKRISQNIELTPPRFEDNPIDLTKEVGVKELVQNYHQEDVGEEDEENPKEIGKTESKKDSSGGRKDLFSRKRKNSNKSKVISND